MDYNGKRVYDFSRMHRGDLIAEIEAFNLNNADIIAKDKINFKEMIESDALKLALRENKELSELLKKQKEEVKKAKKSIKELRKNPKTIKECLEKIELLMEEKRIPLFCTYISRFTYSKSKESFLRSIFPIKYAGLITLEKTDEYRKNKYSRMHKLIKELKGLIENQN